MFAKLAKGHPDAEAALLSAKKKIEAEESSCYRCIQPMPGMPDCQNIIWKYDFAPASVRAGARKGWRLVVLAINRNSDPKQLVAIACYSKSDESQLSFKELARHARAVQLELPAIDDIK